MERTPVGPRLDPDAALIRRRMLEQGVEQSVVIDQKKLLARIMGAVGARPPKIISETNCGDEGVKMSIEVELPFGGNHNVMVFEGAPSTTKSVAEKNAILLALKHLNQICHISVIDFSIRVARSLQANKTYGYLNEAMTSVQTMLRMFEETLTRIKEMALDFKERQKKETTGDQLPTDALVYVNITNFFASVVERYSLEASETLSKFTWLEKQRIELKKMWMQKTEPIERRTGSHEVVLSSKYLLDYVLSYFGFENATYSNGPVGAESVEGEAKFKIPEIKRLRLHGNLIIRGCGDSSASSEEDAAFRSLMLMEENLNIKIVDLYHSRRVDTEQLQNSLLVLARNVLSVGDSVKDLWSQLMNDFQKHRDSSGYDTSVLNLGGKAGDQITAYQVTMRALDELEGKTAKVGYEVCWELFHKLEDIKYQLDTI